MTKALNYVEKKANFVGENVEKCGQVLNYVCDKSVGLVDKSVELCGKKGELCGRKC